MRVWVTGRSEAKRAVAEKLGAHATFDSGERLPGKVDAVFETVGDATWSHSMRALKPGGVIVVSGATSGPNPGADLQRLFFLQMRVIGSTMGTRDELANLLEFVANAGITPEIGLELPDGAGGVTASGRCSTATRPGRSSSRAETVRRAE